MAGLGKSLTALNELRCKFESLLAAASRKSPAAAPDLSDGASRPRELKAFGSNPGNLRMLVHVPEQLQSEPPLVVALHGCGQSGSDYIQGTGWATLADRLGFVVLSPEQRPSNNPKSCFSWFLPGDTARGCGEALSIQQMVEHAIAKFAVDRRRVFITGLSAGGAMTSVMLATYPEVYAGGAIIAGLPYGCAGSVQEALQAMFSERSPSARALGDHVRAASGHRGPWPRISVWHGSADPIVKPSNGEHVARQWANIHGLSSSATHTELGAGYTRRVWDDVNGTTLIEAYSIAGMAHGVPIASLPIAEHCGVAGAFFHDVGLSSTHRIARFWNLDHRRFEAQCAEAASMISPGGTGRGAGTIEVAASVGGEEEEIGLVSGKPEKTGPWRPPLDPNIVIAAAFKSAGLPVPEVPTRVPGTSSPVDPGAIIEAALKAAGLRR